MFKLYRIHLKSRDVVKAAQWYIDRLGAKKMKDYHDGGGHHILVDLDGIEIILTQPLNAATMPVAPAEPHIGLEHFGLVTDDVDALLGDMQAHGVDIIETSPPNRQDRFAFVRAPDGVRLELVQATKSDS